MSLIDWLAGAGIIGIIILIAFLVFVPAIAAVVVATMIASYFSLTGLGWWAVVILLFLFIMGILGRLSSS